MKVFTRITILLICLVFSNRSGIQAQSNSFSEATRKMMQSNATKGAVVSWCFRDVETGQILSAYQEQTYLMPASTAKLFSTAAALKILGADFTFKTQIVIQGEIKDGVLRGDLCVIGGGDPTLGSGKAGAMTAENILGKIYQILQEKGIRKIKGNLIVDPYFFRFDHTAVPRNWPWEDIGNYYGAGSYGLNWRENSFQMSFSPGDTIGAISKYSRPIPELYNVEFRNAIKAGNTPEEIYVYSAPLSSIIYLDGVQKPKGESQTERGSIPNPPVQFIGELDSYLKNKGIRISGKSQVAGIQNSSLVNCDTLGVIASPPLLNIVNEINHTSHNLFAESVGKMLGKQAKIGTRAEDGAQAIRGYLKNSLFLSDSLMILQDASGLSRTNHISTAFQTSFLRSVASQSGFEDFVKTIPEAGKSGSMKSFPEIPNVRAKSGSIGGVRGYAGYMKDVNDRKITFSVLLNNFNAPSSEIKQLCAELIREAQSGGLPETFKFFPFHLISDTLYSLPEITWFDKSLKENPTWQDLNTTDREDLRLRMYLSGEPTRENPYKIAVFRSKKDPWNDRFRFRIHAITRKIERWDESSKTFVPSGYDTNVKMEKTKSRKGKNKK